MARETVFTAIIPAILIFFLVFFNIRKMQKQAKIMKMEHEGKCGEIRDNELLVHIFFLFCINS